MDFTLTREDKIRSLDQVLVSVQVNLFNCLLEAGYDPETFDETSFEIPAEAFPMSIFHRIQELLEKLSNIKNIKNSL
jgi:hypothetical protein